MTQLQCGYVPCACLDCCLSYWTSVFLQELQSSEEDPGETLKRTIKAQRQRQRNRVLPLSPSFVKFHIKQFSSACLNTLIQYVLTLFHLLGYVLSGARAVFSSEVAGWWCGGDLHCSVPQSRWRTSSKGSWTRCVVKTPTRCSERLVSMLSDLKALFCVYLGPLIWKWKCTKTFPSITKQPVSQWYKRWYSELCIHCTYCSCIVCMLDFRTVICVLGVSSRVQHTTDFDDVEDLVTRRLKERLKAARVKTMKDIPSKSCLA